jgi:2,4-dienoyl-CoA reductase (NADPH2)
LAKNIPGKEEFNETIRYFEVSLKKSNVVMKLGQAASAADLESFDEVILATGVQPRSAGIPGEDHPRCVSYLDVLKGQVVLGAKVAVIGAGGIGFDVAEFLVEAKPSLTLRPHEWLKAWGVDETYQERGALLKAPSMPAPTRQVWMLQRKSSKMGAGLGKTTGWIHRQDLQKRNVKMLTGVEYHQINDQGLEISVHGKRQTLEVDHIVICAGQSPQRELLSQLRQTVHVIGGADVAAELDAKRAIRQGTVLGEQI